MTNATPYQSGLVCFTHHYAQRAPEEPFARLVNQTAVWVANMIKEQWWQNRILAHRNKDIVLKSFLPLSNVFLRLCQPSTPNLSQIWTTSDKHHSTNRFKFQTKFPIVLGCVSSVLLVIPPSLKNDCRRRVAAYFWSPWYSRTLIFRMTFLSTFQSCTASFN